MSDYNFEISLRPVESYFFGGERTFGTAGDEKSSYYAVSNPYPQQTTLLGMLRYFLLQQNHCLPLNRHKQKATQLIGPQSFKADQSQFQTFGALQSLSALMLKKSGTYYRLGYALPPHSLELNQKEQQVLTAGGIRSVVPNIEGYKAKDGLPWRAIPAEVDQSPVDTDEIFIAQEQVGIRKISTEEGFFKQKLYRLADGWQFVCFARLAPDHGLSDGLVKFGADQKQFVVQVRQVQADTFPQWQGPVQKTASLTLLSDALVSQEIYNHCEFAISQTADFRTVRMAYDGETFHKDPVKYNLLKRGSILMPGKGGLQKLTAALDANSNYRNIGFNQYYISNH